MPGVRDGMEVLNQMKLSFGKTSWMNLPDQMASSANSVPVHRALTLYKIKILCHALSRAHAYKHEECGGAGIVVSHYYIISYHPRAMRLEPIEYRTESTNKS